VHRAALVPVCIALGLAGCGGDESPEKAAGAGSSSTTVEIVDFKYKPATIEVERGDAITWDNVDTAGHTATADDRSFDTAAVDKGESKKVTMTDVGTFAYHCDFHPFMKGKVVVR
jgi:plastocyanin